MGRLAIGLAIGITVCLASGCGLRGNGKLTDDARTVAAFLTVQNASNVKTTIEEGPAFNVTVTLDSNLQSSLTTTVNGGTLVIDVTRPEDLEPSSGSVVKVVMPDFEGATLSGSAEIVVSNLAAAHDRALALNGSGELAFNGPAAHLTLSSSGSGTTLLTGTADLLDVTSSGSGEVNAESLSATSANLNTSGSGAIEATLNGGTVNFDLSGSGSIYWHGTATVGTSTDHGSGQVFHL